MKGLEAKSVIRFRNGQDPDGYQMMRLEVDVALCTVTLPRFQHLKYATGLLESYTVVMAWMSTFE